MGSGRLIAGRPGELRCTVVYHCDSSQLPALGLPTCAHPLSQGPSAARARTNRCVALTMPNLRHCTLRHCLPADLEWKIVYVGSAESEKYDQVLDTVFVGPVAPGQYRFVFQVCSSRYGGFGSAWRSAGCDTVRKLKGGKQQK